MPHFRRYTRPGVYTISLNVTRYRTYMDSLLNRVESRNFTMSLVVLGLNDMVSNLFAVVNLPLLRSNPFHPNVTYNYTITLGSSAVASYVGSHFFSHTFTERTDPRFAPNGYTVTFEATLPAIDGSRRTYRMTKRLYVAGLEPAVYRTTDDGFLTTTGYLSTQFPMQPVHSTTFSPT